MDLLNAAPWHRIPHNIMTHPNIREYYSTYYTDMTMFLAANDDGTIWRIPGDVSESCCLTLLVRQDWLEALNMKALTNTKEFKEMLRAFTEDDPDKNGQDDTYGFTGAGTEWRSRAPFMYPFKADPINFVLKDGKVSHGSIQPEMKEALAFMRECFTAGYIDPAILTSNNCSNSNIRNISQL